MDQCSDQERILEQIDACRPGSDDLAAPEMRDLAARVETDPEIRALYDQVQGFDTAIREAMQEVPVPSGLAGRITAQLAAAQLAAAEHDPRNKTRVAVAEPSTPQKHPGRRHNRRRWLAGLTALVTAASLAGVAVWWNWPEPPRQWTEGEILEQAIAFYQRDNRQANRETGQLIRQSPPPEDFSFDPQQVAADPDRTTWRKVRGLLDQAEAIAYDIPGPRGVTARLYVVRIKVPGLPRVMPDQSAFNTAGLRVSAWQDSSKGLVYVLVVPGEETHYRDFLKRPMDQIIT